MVLMGKWSLWEVCDHHIYAEGVLRWVEEGGGSAEGEMSIQA